MKLTNRTCLLMCLCAASFVWQSDASMAQQFPPQQYEPIEIIPSRQSGRNTPFRVPLAQAPFQEGSGGRNFDPRSEAFGPREAQEYRRPYRGVYQGEEFAGPEAARAREGYVQPQIDGPHQGGGSGHRGQGGHGGCGKCRGGQGGHGHHPHRRNGSPELQQFEAPQFNQGADVTPSLSAFYPRDEARRWWRDSFVPRR